MPSTAIQSRIHTFESLGSNSTNYPPSTSKINPQRSPNLLEEPISPTAKSYSPIVPSTPYRSFSSSPSPSPPNLGRKTSLIDLRDWVVDDGPMKHTSGAVNSHLNVRRPPPRRVDVSEQVVSTPLINLESPPKARSAPPLPPKKRCYNSLNGSANEPSEPSAPRRSDSLTVEHTYPPFLKLDTSNSRKSLGHAPASSISSFHSVSLSDGETVGTPSSVSNTYLTDRDGGDVDSLDESFENVSALSSPVNFVIHDWGGRENTLVPATNIPPKLPERPKPRHTPSPSHSQPSSPKRPNLPIGSSSRRVPPLPPRLNQSRSPPTRTSPASTTNSDRSSILSTATTATSLTGASLGTQSHSHFKAPSQLSRPTPLPAAAKLRYEAVFVSNVRARRKAGKLATAGNQNLLAPPNPTTSAAAGRQVRKAAGWRGLSVDLITNPEENGLVVNDTGNGSVKSMDSNEDDEVVGSDKRLDGYTVRQIWSCSKLDHSKLREIWNDCDTDQTGSLDIDVFVKGMWRIDEELRRARLGPPLSVRPSKRQPRSINSNLTPR